MRRKTAWSDLSATTCSCSFFFLLRRFDVRMCRPNAWPRTTLPVPVFLNRLDAPLWVFNFGIKNVPRGNCGNSDYSTAISGIIRWLLHGRSLRLDGGYRSGSVSDAHRVTSSNDVRPEVP